MASLLFVTAAPTRAQSLTPPSLSLERARGRKAGGKALMALGIIHLIGAAISGSVMIGASANCQPPECLNEDWVTPIATWTTLAFGLIFSSAGIPLYVSGANGVARATVQPTASGVIVRF